MLGKMLGRYEQVHTRQMMPSTRARHTHATILANHSSIPMFFEIFFC